MQEGSLRCDANISIMPEGAKEFGTRAEIKNLNSFRALERAINYEVERQKEVLEDGGHVVQETRTWDEANGVTLSMRSKEEAHDYRYFPEPDLVPVQLDDAWIERIRETLPELPAQRQARLMSEHGLPEYDASQIVSTKAMAEYFDEAVKTAKDSKAVSNWLLGDVSAYMNNEGKGDKVMCPSVADILKERYGDNFSIWELDDNGEVRVVNGCQYLNLENCRAVAQAGKDYIEVYQTGAVTKEVMGRIGVVATMLLASVLGLIAGLFGILSVIRISKGKIVTASVCGIISAVLAVAGNIIGMLTGYTGYTFACRYGKAPDPVTYEFTGHTQFVAIVILAVVAILFAIIACVVSGAYKRSQKAVADQAAAAAAPVAEPIAE